MTENVVKPHSPFGGAFDHLWNTQKDELGYQYTKDSALMTPEEKAAEFRRLLEWLKMTPEQKRSELEVRKAELPTQENQRNAEPVKSQIPGVSPELYTAPNPKVEADSPAEVCVPGGQEDLVTAARPSDEQQAVGHTEMDDASSIPQGEGVVLIPPEPAVIPEVAEPKRIRITELVKEAYKGWRKGMRIIFDAGTDSGKTYFILNVLLPWAYEKGWKILYLCNRIPLRDQIRQEVEKLGRTEEKVGHWDEKLHRFVYETRSVNKYENMIWVESYQWLETFYEGNRKGALDYLSTFRYIAADEFHYQLTNPAFNEETDTSYTLLEALVKRRPVIYMSATARAFFDHWRECGDVAQENYYHIPADYSYVKKVMFYWNDTEEAEIIRREARHGKVLVFVDSLTHMQKLKKELQDEFGDEIATACSPYRPEARDCDGLEAVLQNEKLLKRISIVTTVFYNGVNIKDPELKCIVSRLWDPIVNAQILGRKRPVSKDDTCIVYFKGYSHDRIMEERKRIRERQLIPASKWKERKKKPKIWKAYLHQQGIVKMLDKYSRTVRRDEFGDGWIWKRRAELLYMVQMKALDLMMEKGYQWGMLQEVSESLIAKIEPLRFKELEDYIEDHLEEKIPWEVMRKEIVEKGCIINPNDRHKDKGIPTLKIINRSLQVYNAVIESNQEWISATERTRFWMLHRLQQ